MNDKNTKAIKAKAHKLKKRSYNLHEVKRFIMTMERSPAITPKMTRINGSCDNDSHELPNLVIVAKKPSKNSGSSNIAIISAERCCDKRNEKLKTI